MLAAQYIATPPKAIEAIIVATAISVRRRRSDHAETRASGFTAGHPATRLGMDHGAREDQGARVDRVDGGVARAYCKWASAIVMHTRMRGSGVATLASKGRQAVAGPMRKGRPMNQQPRIARIASGCAAGAAALLLSMPARADDQAERIKALERQLQTSLQLIEKLSARVSELERATKAAPAASSPEPAAERASPATQATREAAHARLGVEHDAAQVSGHARESGIPVRGFADVEAVWSRGDDPARRNGFSVGTLDLYLTPQFGDRVKALFEIAFEFEESGAGAADMERVQLGYTVNDALTLWLGRFHTPFGLWNTLYHHGANLQTSIFRPRFIAFEDKDGILPVHAVGVWASGKTRLGAQRITYDAYLANGSVIRRGRLDPNSFTDNDANKMLGLNLGYQPAGSLEGLTVGLHGFGSTVKAFATDGTTLSSTRVRAAGAYFSYDTDQWEGIGEYYRFANAATAGGATHTSNAWFAQVGRHVGSLTPFVRYERVSLDPADLYFRAQTAGRSYRRAALGARYMVDPMSSVKFELSSTRESALTQIDETGALVPFAGGSYRRAAVQYSIAF